MQYHPSDAITQQHNATAYMADKNLPDFDALYHFSITESRAFWADSINRLQIAFENVDYAPTAKTVVDASNVKAPVWFPNQRLHVLQSMLKHGDATALIYQHESEDTPTHVSYDALYSKASRIARMLQARDVQEGDYVALDMPMDVEAVACYLGILLAGGIVVCLADSFKAEDIGVRLAQLPRPAKLILTADVTGGARKHPLYVEVIQAAHCPPAIVSTRQEAEVQLERDADMWLHEALAHVEDTPLTPPMQQSNTPLTIIFSSSTSSSKTKEGEAPKAPKGIMWDHASFLKSGIDGHFHHNLQPGQVLCWPTNFGWMMGSFNVAAAFLNGATLALYDGRPNSKGFGRFIEEAGITTLGVVPALPESWMKTKAMEAFDWSKIERFTSTGAPSHPVTYGYMMGLCGLKPRPVIEYMGGTEISGGYLTASELKPLEAAAFNTPTLGTELHIAAEDGAHFAKHEVSIVLSNREGRCPPMGLSSALLNYDHEEKYFAQNASNAAGDVLREHGDVILFDAATGLYRSHGRADNGMNINGIKTSSTELEHYIKSANIEGLEDVAVIAARPKEGGEDLVVAFVVCNDNYVPEMKRACTRAIKAHSPQLAKLHDVVQINAIPRTASNKTRHVWLKEDYEAGL